MINDAIAKNFNQVSIKFQKCFIVDANSFLKHLNSNLKHSTTNYLHCSVSIGSFILQISTLLLNMEKDTLKARARSAKHCCLRDGKQTHRRAFAGHLSAILQQPLHPLPVWSLREYTSDTETNITDSKETQTSTCKRIPVLAAVAGSSVICTNCRDMRFKPSFKITGKVVVDVP